MQRTRNARNACSQLALNYTQAPWLRCLRCVRCVRCVTLETGLNALLCGKKIAKISPVYPEIFDEIRQFFGHVIPDVHK